MPRQPINKIQRTFECRCPELDKLDWEEVKVSFYSDAMDASENYAARLCEWDRDLSPTFEHTGYDIEVRKQGEDKVRVFTVHVHTDPRFEAVEKE